MLDKSEQYSLTVASVFADMQEQIIANRSRLFQNAVRSGLGLRAGIQNQMQAFLEVLDKIFYNTLTETRNLVEREIDKAFNNGVLATDKTVALYNEQGKNIQQVEELDYVERKNGISQVVIGSLIAVMATAKQTTVRDIGVIASTVNLNGESIYAEIDKAQAIFLDKGITGKILSNGTEKSAIAEVEFVVRDNAHTALKLGQTERAREYGLQPLVQISAHPNCCDLCSRWENRVLIDNVYQNGQPNGEYELLSTAIEAGLFHWNCKHNMIAYIPGLDKPDVFERDKVTAAEAAKGYAYEQKQRYIERNIRSWRNRESGSLDSVNIANAKNKVAEWEYLQRQLIKDAKTNGITLYRQYEREEIGGQTRPMLPLLKIG